MNSRPSRRKIGTVERSSTSAPPITTFRLRTAQRTTGAYPDTSEREIGCFRSGRIFPRMTHAARAGVRVTARSAANAIEYVLVKARGKDRIGIKALRK